MSAVAAIFQRAMFQRWWGIVQFGSVRARARRGDPVSALRQGCPRTKEEIEGEFEAFFGWYTRDDWWDEVYEAYDEREPLFVCLSPGARALSRLGDREATERLYEPCDCSFCRFKGFGKLGERILTL